VVSVAAPYPRARKLYLHDADICFVLFGIVEIFGFSGYVAAVVFGAVLGNIEAFMECLGCAAIGYLFDCAFSIVLTSALSFLIERMVLAKFYAALFRNFGRVSPVSLAS
jgi:hypothetical protein